MLENYKNIEPTIYKQMMNALNGNLSHAYLFDVNRNVYAEKMIMEFVKAIFCTNHLNKEEYDECVTCKRIEDGNYPDLIKIYPDGQFIKKESMDMLQEKFSTKSIESDKKVYIIYEAEKLNLSAANSLLKFLEEPGDGIVAILITNNSESVLKTISSRCQILKFNSSKVEDFINKNDIEDKITFYKLSFVLFLRDTIDESIEAFVNSVVSFWKLFESNGKKTILYEKEYYLDVFKEKEHVSNFIKCSILFYRDILNVKLGRNVLFFDDCIDDLKAISSKNSLEKLYKKVGILLNKEKLTNKNVNSNLFIDGIIIDMED